MKNLLKISLFLAVLCFAIPVYADGDMTTGNKTCTQNCGGLRAENNPTPTTLSDQKQDESTIGNVYNWLFEQIATFLD